MGSFISFLTPSFASGFMSIPPAVGPAMPASVVLQVSLSGSLSEPLIPLQAESEVARILALLLSVVSLWAGRL